MGVRDAEFMVGYCPISLLPSCGLVLVGLKLSGD